MKTLPIILFCLFILTYHNLYGQVELAPIHRHRLHIDITSTNKGMLLPHDLGGADGDQLPATGLLVFDTTTGSFGFQQ